MRHFLGIVLLVLSSSPSFAQATLEYRLNKDAIFTIKQDAKQVITQELDGATHEVTNDIDGILEFKVMDEREDSYDISFTFKDLNLRVTSSIQGELMNIKAKEVNMDDAQSKIFNSLLNSPIKMVLAKTGDILEVDGGDKLVGKMIEASGLKDEFSLNTMKKSLHREFGSEALSNSYEQMTFIYPSKMVEVGDSWKNEYSGNLKATTTWTLDGLTSEKAVIVGEANVNMDVTELATTMKLSGKQQTKITTDLDSGFIQKMQVEGLSKGSSKMSQMGDREIPTTIQSTVTYELIADTQTQLNN